jgi:predicted Zn-dependent protease with MMP-like domain
MAYHVSRERFSELVERALAELPPQFAHHLEEVPVEVKTRPSRKLLRSLGMEEDELLLGLYHGRALTERSVEYSAGRPGETSPLDVIYVFQEDIELVSESEQDLVREVRTTVLHEIGHHFGLDEDDLERLGYG